MVPTVSVLSSGEYNYFIISYHTLSYTCGIMLKYDFYKYGKFFFSMHVIKILYGNII